MPRSYLHDYRAVSIYHITMCKAAEAPLFSRLCGELQATSVELSALGRVLEKLFWRIPALNPRLKVLQYIIMPDHIHLLLYVTAPIEKAIGSYIGMLKVKARQQAREAQICDCPIFTPDFYDRIIYKNRSLDAVVQYIRQNPYRLAVRHARPDFFRKQRSIDLSGRNCQAYGNLFLLRNPAKYALVVHRADNESIFKRKLEDCLYMATNGGVVVSAFISPREKQIRRQIESSNGRIILVGNRPLIERQKPAAHDFDLCCRGQLLLISPLDYMQLPQSEHPSRQQCLDMNALAKTIAES